MRHIYFLPLLIFITTGCTSRLEEEAFKKLRPKLKAPDTYKLISIEPIDTLTEFANISNCIDHHEQMQDDALNLISEYLKDAEKTDNADYEFRKIDELFLDYRLDSAMIEFLTPKLLEASEDSIVAIKHAYRFRCENDNGDIAPNLYYLWATPEGGVIQIAEDIEKLNPTPRGITGYEERLTQEYTEYKAKKREITTGKE